MKKVICLSLGIILLNITDVHGSCEPRVSPASPHNAYRPVPLTNFRLSWLYGNAGDFYEETGIPDVQSLIIADSIHYGCTQELEKFLSGLTSIESLFNAVGHKRFLESLDFSVNDYDKQLSSILMPSPPEPKELISRAVLLSSPFAHSEAQSLWSNITHKATIELGQLARSNTLITLHETKTLIDEIDIRGANPQNAWMKPLFFQLKTEINKLFELTHDGMNLSGWTAECEKRLHKCFVIARLTFNLTEIAANQLNESALESLSNSLLSFSLEEEKMRGICELIYEVKILHIGRQYFDPNIRTLINEIERSEDKENTFLLCQKLYKTVNDIEQRCAMSEAKKSNILSQAAELMPLFSQVLDESGIGRNPGKDILDMYLVLQENWRNGVGIVLDSCIELFKKAQPYIECPNILMSLGMLLARPLAEDNASALDKDLQVFINTKIAIRQAQAHDLTDEAEILEAMIASDSLSEIVDWKTFKDTIEGIIRTIDEKIEEKKKKEE